MSLDVYIDEELQDVVRTLSEGWKWIWIQKTKKVQSFYKNKVKINGFLRRLYKNHERSRTSNLSQPRLLLFRLKRNMCVRLFTSYPGWPIREKISHDFFTNGTKAARNNPITGCQNDNMLLLTSFQTFFLCTGDYFGEKALKNIGNTATATCKAATSRLVCYMIHADQVKRMIGCDIDLIENHSGEHPGRDGKLPTRKMTIPSEALKRSVKEKKIQLFIKNGSHKLKNHCFKVLERFQFVVSLYSIGSGVLM